MTTPDQVRAGLVAVTSAAVADTAEVAAAGTSPTDIRAALFAATPLIVGDYIDGSAALALDWYDERRDAARPRTKYTPRPFTVVSDADIATSVAVATEPLYRATQEPLTDDLVKRATEDSLDLLALEVQHYVASGFWDTVTGNVDADPSAVGWQRYARGAACKFCLMIAGRGAVFRQGTANFAAHKGCHCVAGPSFDPSAPRASAMQYVAASSNRTPAQRAALRNYLNDHFPDAPG